MSKALIISDHSAVANQINSKFDNVGWTVENTNLKAIFNSDDFEVGKNQCVLLVIDVSFINHFGKYVNDMSSMVRNCAICAPLYLIFEGDYDPNFSSWLDYSKRLFQSVIQPHKLQQAIEEIIRLETKVVPRVAYISPMDAY